MGPQVEYTVTAHSDAHGAGIAHVKATTIEFDSSPEQSETLPGPADLLVTAFAACMLKNVERFGHMLDISWSHACVEATGERQDSPPKMIRLTYRLTIVTDENTHKIDLLHRNIARHGTVYNTLAAACEVTGEIRALTAENYRAAQDEHVAGMNARRASAINRRESKTDRSASADDRAKLTDG